MGDPAARPEWEETKTATRSLGLQAEKDILGLDKKTPVKYGFEPIVVSGRFAVLKDDPTGVLYRLTDAEAVGSAMPEPAVPKK